MVYKPISGERPLWDFPDGTLAGRERAAYLLSELGGWCLIPRTILREGPRGPGMVQDWIGELDGDPDSVVHIIRVADDPEGLIPVLRATDEAGRPLLVAHEDASDVRALSVLDCVLNNTDRKGAHAFRCAGQLYAVDHGLTFHAEPKLRTVLWGWTETIAGQGDRTPECPPRSVGERCGAGERTAFLSGADRACRPARSGARAAGHRPPSRARWGVAGDSVATDLRGEPAPHTVGR